MSFPDLFRAAASRYPHGVSVVEGSRSLTFKQVDERADRAASAFVNAGLTPGDRVAVLAFNELEYLEIMVATNRAGLVLVPMNFRFNAAELQDMIDDAEPKLLIHGPDLEGVASSVTGTLVWHLGSDGLGDSYEGHLAGSSPTEHPPLDADALAVLLYTSGTMGRAKGAMITNRAQLARVESLAIELRMGFDDVFLQVLPMFHLAQTFSAAFAFVGATNVMMRRFDAGGALELIDQHKVTRTLVAPSMMNAMMASPTIHTVDISTLRSMLYGAAPISATQLSACLEAFQCEFFQMYGMTETGPATLLRPEDHDPIEHPELLVSCGRSILTFDVDIVDENGQLQPRGESGEIVIRGETVMNGYWKLDSDTSTLSGGWMHTGDGGHIGHDGRLYVTDRIKDIVITGGENVSSREVEDVIASHPAVLEVAVVGVPDDRYGERVHGVIVLRPDQLLDEPGLDALCLAKLAPYKRPRSYSQLDALPRNAVGKVLKRVIRAELTQPIHLEETKK